MLYSEGEVVGFLRTKSCPIKISSFAFWDSSLLCSWSLVLGDEKNLCFLDFVDNIMHASLIFRNCPLLCMGASPWCLSNPSFDYSLKKGCFSSFPPPLHPVQLGRGLLSQNFCHWSSRILLLIPTFKPWIQQKTKGISTKGSSF